MEPSSPKKTPKEASLKDIIPSASPLAGPTTSPTSAATPGSAYQPSSSTPVSRPTSATIRGLPPSLQVPPLPPSIHRSLLLSTSPEGLVIVPSRRSRSKGVIIEWGAKGKVRKLDEGAATRSDHDAVEQEDGIDIKGIAGIVRLWNAAYLLVIIDPKLIGSFPTPSHEIYSLTNIQAIPLTLSLASQTLDKLRKHQQQRQAAAAASQSSGPTEDGSEDGRSGLKYGEVQTPGLEDTSREEDSDDEEESEDEEEAKPAGKEKKKEKKRFTWNPFEKLIPSLENIAKPSAPNSSSQSTSTSAVPTPPSESITSLAPPPALDPPPSKSHPEPSSSPTPPPAPSSSERSQLETKIITSLISTFTSGQMWFSYDTDLTNSLAVKQARLAAEEGGRGGNDAGSMREPLLHLPLWRRVDKRFWWNESMMKEFIELGLHAFILPIMQGWVQIATINVNQLPPSSDSRPETPPADEPIPQAPADPVPTVPIEFILISRRSRDRAGLRFQRRGIDDEGNVANFVESEQVVRCASKGRAFSFVQVRGSIPLFWSQSPYSTPSHYALKPAPVLERPIELAEGPTNMHFEFLNKTYGKQTVISLSELTGKEASVTNGYREVLANLGRKDVQYLEFDFHNECRGMKFENVKKLVDQLDFESQGYLEVGNPSGLKKQFGAFRTNCIDCLDRTNVVQSALARHVLSLQLASLNLGYPKAIPGSTPSTQKTELELIFNDVWANNGDAISRAYAGTSALKGDFTRTGKRDLHGMINDGLNSLARMYSSAFSDFFAQAVISFSLGQRSLAIFSEFEQTLSIADAGDILRLSVVRTEAIETCSARCITEGETRLAGWTLFSPKEMNVKTGEFEEKVLLLTKKALYVCRYDYNLEKVVAFTRISLPSILSLQKGPYVTSPLQEVGQDETENFGFKIAFHAEESDSRITSYSVDNAVSAPSTPSVLVEGERKDLGAATAGAEVEEGTNRRRSGGLKPLFTGSSSSPAKDKEASPALTPTPEPDFFVFKAIPRDVILHARQRDNRPAAPSSPATARPSASPNQSKSPATTTTTKAPAAQTSGQVLEDEEEEDDDLRDAKTCRELVEAIVGKIRVACGDAGGGWDSMDGKTRFVVDEAIVSLAEAQKNVSIVSKLEYGIKRFLWL